MTPFYFGPPERRLFAIVHPHETEGPGRGGVVLVAPFGHEAIRTHRLYRVLADRLARLGFDALRFDAYGAGDSGGDDADVRLEGWSADIARAGDELARRTGAATAWWLGARLGASAIVLARAATALQGGRPPSLALWDPVVDGPAYLDELRRRHVDALEKSFSIADPRWRRRLDEPLAYADEALGFAIPAALREAVLALRPESLALASGAAVAVVCSPSAGPALRWAHAHAAAGGVRVLQRDFEWTSDDSLDTALVPTDALSALLQAIDGASH